MDPLFTSNPSQGYRTRVSSSIDRDPIAGSKIDVPASRYMTWIYWLQLRCSSGNGQLIPSWTCIAASRSPNDVFASRRTGRLTRQGRCERRANQRRCRQFPPPRVVGGHGVGVPSPEASAIASPHPSPPHRHPKRTERVDRGVWDGVVAEVHDVVANAVHGVKRRSEDRS